MDRKRDPREIVGEMFVIYDSPIDLPCLFVVRRFEFDYLGYRPTRDFAIGLTLEAARAELPVGLECLGRFPDDDPKIVEVWM